MSNDRIDFLTPVGRLVQGSLSEPQKKDAEGNPLVYKNGANKGQPRVDYFIGLAIPKTDPGISELWQKCQQTAKMHFPNLFDASGNCISPKFSWKMVDGDSTVPNSNGNKPCDREGFPGHFVFSINSSFPPKCFTKGGLEIISDPSIIKAGYYIRVYGNMTGNGSAQQPGIFLNHTMIEFIGYGEEIVFGPSGEAIFGGTPVAQLPPGASATPLAPATTIAAAAMPGAPATPAAPGATPAPGGGVQPAAPATPAPEAMPGAPATPAPGGGVQPAATNWPTKLPTIPGATPAAPGATPAPGGGVQPAADFLNPPPAAPEEKYNLNGTIYTRAQLEAGNWTPEQIASLPRG